MHYLISEFWCSEITFFFSALFFICAAALLLTEAQTFRQNKKKTNKQKKHATYKLCQKASVSWVVSRWSGLWLLMYATHTGLSWNEGSFCFHSTTLSTSARGGPMVDD
jgi:uncharacterized membrane protein